MIDSFRETWQRHPLMMILVLAFCLRLVAVVFSKGYGFSDDHFEVVEPAQSWVNGERLWLEDDEPPMHSILYAGAHFVVFYGAEQLGIIDPQGKMMLIRLLHALWSLLVVWLGYKITHQLSGREAASYVGLMLAALWFMPFMSVRSLNEMTCIPLIMGALYLVVARSKGSVFFLTGILFGVALCIRFQCSHFLAGVGLVLLYQKKWSQIAYLSIGTLASAFVIQGVIDLWLFDYPFQSFVHYISYNSTGYKNYPQGPVYQYLFVVLGMLVPPLSLFLLFAFFRSWKRSPYLFWGAIVFLIVHSIYPGKQERFILPVLPLIIILGTVGWREFMLQSSFWQQRKKLWRSLVIFSVVINLIALAIMTTNYSKKTRVEGMYFFSDKSNVCGIIVESNYNTNPLAPKFYLGKNSGAQVYNLTSQGTIGELKQEMKNTSPNYVLFYGINNLDKRIEAFKQEYGTDLSFENKIEPDLYDKILHLLNPVHNRNESCHIYKMPIDC